MAISFVPGRSLRARAVSGAAGVLAKPAATLGGHLLGLPWPFALAELAAKRIPRLPGVVVEPVRIGELDAELIWPALMVNYRQGPRFAVSQSVLDCASAFEWLVGRGYAAGDISIVGDSAGGFLTIATAITARNRKLGTPAGLVCWSPGLDFTPVPHRRGRPRDSLIARSAYNALCRSLARMEPAEPVEAGRIQSTTSLLTADVTGLPPTLIQVGSHEFVAEDTVGFAHHLANRGVTTTFELWERQVHVLQILADVVPEGMAALRRTALFLNDLHYAAPDTGPAA